MAKVRDHLKGRHGDMVTRRPPRVSIATPRYPREFLRSMEYHNDYCAISAVSVIQKPRLISPFYSVDWASNVESVSPSHLLKGECAQSSEPDKSQCSRTQDKSKMTIIWSGVPGLFLTARSAYQKSAFWYDWSLFEAPVTKPLVPFPCQVTFTRTLREYFKSPIRSWGSYWTQALLFDTNVNSVMMCLQQKTSLSIDVSTQYHNDSKIRILGEIAHSSTGVNQCAENVLIFRCDYPVAAIQGLLHQWSECLLAPGLRLTITPSYLYPNQLTATKSCREDLRVLK